MNNKAIKITSIGLAAFTLFASQKVVMGDIAGSKVGTISKNNKEVSLEVDKELMQEYENADEDLVIELPEFAKSEVNRTLKIKNNRDITVKDLRNVQELYLINDDENTDLSWLNYCVNLKYLAIMGDIVNNTDSIIKLVNLQKLHLCKNNSETGLDCKKLTFLSRCSALETLELDADFNPKYLNEIVNGKNLIIHNNSYLHNIRDLDFVDTLTICDDPYDIAIKLSSNDIECLQQKGVNIVIDDSEFSLQDLKNVSKRLDDIVDNLDVGNNATDEEKINAVLVYCLEHLEYSSEIFGKQIDELNSNDMDEYYKKGRLYGALEKDDQICGNYEALMEALLYRLGVNSYAMYSYNHTWNLVEVDGEYYYYDPTWLDSDYVMYTVSEKDEEKHSEVFTFKELPSEDVIQSKDSELIDQLIWYKVSPKDYEANTAYYDREKIGSHDANNYQLVIKRISEEEKTDNPANSLYEVTVDNKKFVIAGGALIGLLAALGITLAVRKKKEEKRMREINQFNIDLYPIDLDTYKWRK